MKAEALRQCRARHGLLDATIGREGLIQRARGMVREGRALSLVGSPGVGKSRIACELAALGAAAGADVVLCDLSSALTLERVAEAVAEGLGLPTASPVATPERLGEALGAWDGSLWLVLDDVDPLADQMGPVLERWLLQSTDLHLITTCRGHLGGWSPHVLRVAPLSTESSEGEESDAARMFLAQHARHPGPSVASAELAERIVRQVGGLPIAIKLAASLTASLGGDSVSTLLSRSTTDTLPELKTLLRSSWNALHPNDRDLLAGCAVFDADVTLETIGRVAGATLHAVAPAVRRLVDASWLTLRAADAGSRFAVHPVMREFCAEASPEAHERAKDAHLSHFAEKGFRLGVAEHRQDATTLGALRSMRSDLLAAFDHAMHRAARSRAIMVGLALSPRAARLSPARLASLLERALALPATEREPLEPQAWVELANAYALSGRAEDAEAALARATAEGETTSRSVEIRSTWIRAGLRLESWALEAATDELDHLFGLHRSGAPQPASFAWALNQRAVLHAMAGRRERCLEDLLAAAEVARRGHRASDAAFFLTNAAMILLDQDTGRARVYLEEALAVFAELGAETPSARAMVLLATVALLEDQLEEGASLLERAVQQSTFAGLPHVLRDALWTAGQLDRMRGNPHEARRKLEVALGLPAPEHSVQQKQVEASLAAVFGELGMLEEAQRRMLGIEAHTSWLPREARTIEAERRGLALRGCAPEDTVAALQRVESLRVAVEDEPTAQSRLVFRVLAPLVRSLEPAEGVPLVLDLDARWLAYRGERFDFRRRRVAWRLVDTLARHAGTAMEDDALIATVWEDEHMRFESARNRLHVAVSTTRKLLDADVIERVDGGYRLAVPVRFGPVGAES